MTLTSFWRRYLPASLKKATSNQLSVLSAARISRRWIHQRLSPRSNTSTHLLRLTEEHRVTQTALSASPRCKFRQKKSDLVNLLLKGGLPEEVNEVIYGAN